MTTPMIQIGDQARQMTENEHAEHIKACKDVDAYFEQIETNRKAKEQARAAVLAKLGLTADEAAALLG